MPSCAAVEFGLRVVVADGIGAGLVEALAAHAARLRAEGTAPPRKVAPLAVSRLINWRCARKASGFAQLATRDLRLDGVTAERVTGPTIRPRRLRSCRPCRLVAQTDLAPHCLVLPVFARGQSWTSPSRSRRC